MNFKISLAALFCFFLMSCASEPGEPENTQAVTPTDGHVSGGMNDIKSQAIDENDRFGRVNHSLGILQKEFQISNNIDHWQGKMTVFVDENFTMLIRQEIDGKVFDSKVNLKNLNPENGGMRLIPNQGPDEHPGFSISVIDGKEGVERSEDGKVVAKDERELHIFMSSRENIEKVVPAFVQALNVVHGKN